MKNLIGNVSTCIAMNSTKNWDMSPTSNLIVRRPLWKMDILRGWPVDFPFQTGMPLVPLRRQRIRRNQMMACPPQAKQWLEVSNSEGVYGHIDSPSQVQYFVLGMTFVCHFHTAMPSWISSCVSPAGLQFIHGRFVDGIFLHHHCSFINLMWKSNVTSAVNQSTLLEHRI